MCFGNSHFHLDAWRLLMEFGGDALLHEVSLCGLYLTLDAAGLLGARGPRPAPARWRAAPSKMP